MNITTEKIKELYIASLKLKKHTLSKLISYSIDSDGNFINTIDPKKIENREDIRAVCEYTSSFVNAHILLQKDNEGDTKNICEPPGVKEDTKTYLWDYNLRRELSRLIADTYVGPGRRLFSTLIRICQPPFEYMVGDKTCRFIYGDGCIMHQDSGERYVSYCVAQSDKTYNYLDQGKYLYFVSQHEISGILTPESYKLNRVYAFDQIDPNTFLLLFLLTCKEASAITDKVLTNTNGVYIRADMQASLIVSLEQKIFADGNIDGRLTTYNNYKENCFKLMRLNSQNIVYKKFHAGELASMKFHDMTVTRTKTSYENISLEADDLYPTIISKLNSVSDDYNIYNILDAYVKYKLIEINNYAMNQRCTGFLENKSIIVRINDMPIEIAVCTENTRRKINGYLIKASEVGKCLHRATCYHNVEDYNLFLRDVAYLSLEVRDAFANGLPIKLWVQNQDHYYSTELRNPATGLHPKLWFINEGRRHVYLYLNPDKSNKVRIKKFTSFIGAVKTLDRKINGRRNKNCEWGKRELLLLIDRFVETPLSTIVQNSFIDTCLAERAEAQRKSEALLGEIVKATGAVECQYRNSPAYKVTGTLREYYVLKDTNQVYAADSGKYICIVTNKGDMGVGYDDLTSRILHLKNDERVMNKITTLRK